MNGMRYLIFKNNLLICMIFFTYNKTNLYVQLILKKKFQKQEKSLVFPKYKICIHLSNDVKN